MRVAEADDMAHDLLRRGTETHRLVVESFGRSVLWADGEVDRAALGRMVFADRRRLFRLNAIVHPEVKRVWREWLCSEEQSGTGEAVVVVPLLYEVGEGSGWDAVIAVTSSRSVQIERMLGRGLTAVEAEARLGAQMANPEKEALADYVIRNDGSMGLLERQARMVVDSIRRRK